MNFRYGDKEIEYLKSRDRRLGEVIDRIGQSLDEHECLTVHLLDRAEVRRLLDENEIFQSLMAAPLWRYFCERKD